MIYVDRRDAILCVSGYTGWFASLDLHTGDAKYCVSTKFLHLQILLLAFVGVVTNKSNTHCNDDKRFDNLLKVVKSEP
jgi:hypothetical protein